MQRRLRRTSTITGDPTWAADNIDPNTATGTLGGTTATGIYAIDIVPEDPDVDTISIEFDRQDAEDDTAIGTALAARGTTLAGTTLSSYLRSVTAAAGVVSVCALPLALPYAIALRAPAGATFVLDADEVWPITGDGDGDGKLFIEFVATDGGEPLASGSGTVDVQVLSVVDRRRPTGKVTDPSATVAVTATDEVATHGIGGPLVVSAPPGFYTVSITGAASLPAGTDELEIWVGKVTG